MSKSEAHSNKDDGTDQTTNPQFEVTDTDLTAFQQNILFVARGYQKGRYTTSRGGDGPAGLAIKDVLDRDEWYDEEIHHGRLYLNLDQLVEKGLLAKSELDKRTNEYTLTDAGLGVIAQKLQREIACFKGEREGGDSE